MSAKKGNIGARVALRDCAYNKHMERVGMTGKVVYSKITFKDPLLNQNCSYEIALDNGETDYFRACEFDAVEERVEV